MGYPNHNYINDGIMYTTQAFDEFGNNVAASRFWERWAAKGPNTHAWSHKIMSYDDGYVVNQLVDLRLAGNTDLMLLSTVGGRKLYCTLDSTLLTKRGMLSLREIGIGTELVTVDFYKGYHGDHLKMDTTGNGRIRALLRNHGITFGINELNGTVTEHGTLYCVDYDTPEAVREGNWITFGLNNYRESVKAMFGLEDTSTDVVSHIVSGKRNHIIGMYVDGPQNIVLQNGIVVKSTQTEVRNDR